MKIWIERNYYLGSYLLLATVIAVVVALALPAAAAPLAKEPEEFNCEPWRKAGQWTMYLCAEDWELGAVCIHSDSGFMSCKWDE